MACNTILIPQLGEARWSVVVTNQDGEVTASYDLLTMNAV